MLDLPTAPFPTTKTLIAISMSSSFILYQASRCTISQLKEIEHVFKPAYIKGCTQQMTAENKEGGLNVSLRMHSHDAGTV